MRYRELGRTGIDVSGYCLGTMMSGRPALRPANFDPADPVTAAKLDAVVPPGHDLYPPNASVRPPSLTEPARRRRPVEAHSAA